jgi:hypothetical protein
MAGFLTTHDQQQIRRFARRLPVRALIYGAGAAGWLLGPAVNIDSAEWWRSFAVQGVGLLLMALIEFALALLSEATWAGPPWANGGRPARRWVVPLTLAAIAGMGAYALRWSLHVEEPGWLLCPLIVAAILMFGTMRHALRQPADQEGTSTELARDQMRLMAAFAARGQRMMGEGEMRPFILATLVDLPDNRAAHLIAWQLALKHGDMSDAVHHCEHLRRLKISERDLTEVEALTAMARNDPSGAAEALGRRVELIHAKPRETLAGQRADFVAILLHAISLVRMADWRRAADHLDGIASDYETAPFVGPIDRLIVNHLRWQTANELGAEQTVRLMEQRCRRYARRSVRGAARRQIERAERDGSPDAIRWWPGAARAALAWWEKARAVR